MKTFAAAAAIAAGLFAATAAPPPNFTTRTTQDGCVFYEWLNPRDEQDYSAGSTWTWSAPCEPGKPISGTGTLFEVYGPSSPGHASSTKSGRFVGGYYDGPWPYKMTRRTGETLDFEAPTYRMGCQLSFAGDVFYADCTPGAVEEAVAAAPPADEKPAAASGEDGSGGNDGDGGDPDGAADDGGEPGGPDHVTESGEGGRETDRFIAARVSRERAPKHHPEHDMSQCLGKYLEEHRPPHNHYVLYNKCDTPINVVWCVMGPRDDCEAGAGSIANMGPRIGYIAGMEDSPGMKAGACSGKVWPIMENGQMAGYGCE